MAPLTSGILLICTLRKKAKMGPHFGALLQGGGCFSLHNHVWKHTDTSLGKAILVLPFLSVFVSESPPPSSRMAYVPNKNRCWLQADY